MPLRSRTRPVVAAAVCAVAAVAQFAQPQVFRVVEDAAPRDVGPVSLALDVDLDGDTDALTAAGWLLSDGLGRLTASTLPVPTQLLANLPAAAAVTVVDLEGDGDADVVIDNGLVPPVFFVLQNGSFTAFNGAYPPAASVAAAASTGLFRALDLDGDGLVDFVRIGSDGSTLVLRQTSLLNFATATLSPPIPGAGQFVETFADADADGDLDAVAYDAVAHAFRLYRRFGLAFVADPATLLPPLPNGGTYLGVAAWDADGDGAREFVVAFEPSAPPTTVLPPVVVQYVAANFAGGGVTVWTATGGSLTPYAAYDLNADGLEELLFRPSAGEAFATAQSGVYAFPIGGAPALLAALPGAAVPPGRFDADADGDVDFLMARPDGTLHVYLRRSDGTLRDADAPRDFAGPPWPPLIGDADGDGDPDLLRPRIDAATSFSVAERLNDGLGGFPGDEAVASYLLPATPEWVAGDFDGDGRAEVLRLPDGGSAAAPDRLVRGVGGGWTSTAPGSALAYFSGSDVSASAVGDLDGDGDLDAVSASSAGVTTFLNSGGGVFGPGVVVDAIRQQISDLALGDVTGDGIPEIAIAAQLPVSAPAVVVDAATGAVVHGGLPAALDVELADADGDGDLDLFVDGSLRLNLGATLSPPQQFATNAANGRQLAFDADVDGDVDVLHWQGSTGATLWTNGGGGVQWTPQAVPYPGTALPPQNWTPATPIYRSADVDRDGDPDLFDVFGRAATNCARQIARANPASIGRSTGLEIYGAPNRPVDLFASFAAFQTPIAVPGWGPLFLPPPTAAFVGTFATGGDGRVAIPLSVPLSPAFVGLTFHWQAAFPTEGRLTGALRTTVEAF